MASGIEANPDRDPSQEKDASSSAPQDVCWIDVIDLEDLWIGDMIGLETDIGPLLLINLDGAIFAYENRCPHKGGRLGDGELVNGIIVCPNHRWEFCARGGRGVNPTGTHLNQHAVRIVGDRIQVARRER
jgi:nitrite reductase/ring-hydroxylating ferredoxin subunit